MTTFFRPESLSEAAQALSDAGARALILSGGTDLLVQDRSRNIFDGRTVVDIGGIRELREIRETDDTLIIGACATHSDIANSEPICRYAEILSMACRCVGSAQIRNLGTIGGNLANASPAADTLAALSVLNASISILDGGETYLLPLDELIAAPGCTSLKGGALITQIHIDKLPAYRFAYRKVGRRRAMAISRLSIAVAMRIKDGAFEDVRFAIGAVFPKPLNRMAYREACAPLIGMRPSHEAIEAAAEALSALIPDGRASGAYKRPVCKRVCGQLLEDLVHA